MESDIEHEPAQSGCCAPSRAASPAAARDGAAAADAAGAPDAAAGTAEGQGYAERDRALARMAALPGGAFLMGTDDSQGFPADGEGPVRQVVVSPFAIDPMAVTNARFAEFAAATGYVTEAERFGWSYVFASFLPAALRRESPRPEAAPWWCGVQGAYWAAPEGPGSGVGDRADHPVVHVSVADAAAFCTWAGLRLPTEAEWEYAARGGLEQATYAWGNELTPDGEHRCNIWQGMFPTKNTADDGYRGTAPADAFPPNGYGLYNMAGNVWEWCADWWTTDHPTATQHDPTGPGTGPGRVMRGGSYLCHHSYCNRYRVAARTNNTPDSTSGNTGFRCAR
ncbi:formylglycine-generating enzyme family protein [Streptomonospora sediminis]